MIPEIEKILDSTNNDNNLHIKFNTKFDEFQIHVYDNDVSFYLSRDDFNNADEFELCVNYRKGETRPYFIKFINNSDFAFDKNKESFNFSENYINDNDIKYIDNKLLSFFSNYTPLYEINQFKKTIKEDEAKIDELKRKIALLNHHVCHLSNENYKPIWER